MGRQNTKTETGRQFYVIVYTTNKTMEVPVCHATAEELRPVVVVVVLALFNTSRLLQANNLVLSIYSQTQMRFKTQIQTQVTSNIITTSYNSYSTGISASGPDMKGTLLCNYKFCCCAEFVYILCSSKYQKRK